MDFPDIPDKLSCLELIDPAHNLLFQCDDLVVVCFLVDVVGDFDNG